MIVSKYPLANIKGISHPTTPQNQALVQIITFVQYGLFAFYTFGEKAFAMMEMPVPKFYNMVQNNKIASYITTFIVGNMLTSGLTQTGAFELYYK